MINYEQLFQLKQIQNILFRKEVLQWLKEEDKYLVTCGLLEYLQKANFYFNPEKRSFDDYIIEFKKYILEKKKI